MGAFDIGVGFVNAGIRDVISNEVGVGAVIDRPIDRKKKQRREKIRRQ